MSDEKPSWDDAVGMLEEQIAEQGRTIDGYRNEVTVVMAERDKAYRERAALVAYLSAVYPSVIALDVDPDTPGWAIVYVQTPSGQMSWHLTGGDLDLFRHLEQTGADDPTLPAWDGHTTDEKYERLAELTGTVATGLYGPQSHRPAADVNL